MRLFPKTPPPPPPSPWEFEQLLSGGDEYFASLEVALEQASVSIELETYIFDNDELGRRITERLIDAHKRGVAVRVIVDGVGAHGWVYHLGAELRAAGVPNMVYHQLPWERLWRDHEHGANWARLFERINKRDHRKMCIVDGMQAWVGSANVSAVHLREIHGDAAWRDMGLTVRGEQVNLLRAAFDRLWYRGRKHKKIRKEARKLVISSAGSNVRLNATRKLRRTNYRQLLSRIGEARVRVWIVTGYFVPTGSFLRALTAAANRCVDVRLMISEQSDVFFMPWVASAFYYGLIRAGIQLYNYRPSVLHEKAMLIDDVAIIGSTNLNHRSLIHDLEVDLISSGVGTVSRLTQDFLGDVEHSEGVTLHDFRQLSWWKRLLGRSALAFRHWL